MANKITYTSDGETTTYYFNFPFFSLNDIHVTINNVATAANTYTLHPTASPDDADTQYTGGNIEFTTAPAIGATISIYRDVELARHIDYQPTLQPQSYQLNQDFNQCMAILQEQAEKITNTLGLAAIPTLADLLTELTYIREHIGDCLTEEDLSPLETTIENIENAITTLQGYDYVIESQLPTADNNYTWYRKYKSGWVEQGGIVPQQTSNDYLIVFPIEMSDTNYIWALNISKNSTDTVSFRVVSCWNFTTSTMTCRTDTNFRKSWSIIGVSN